MKKYYFGFLILLIVCAGAVVYAVKQGADAKTDRATDKAVEQISQKLSYSYTTNSTVPESLVAIGLTNLPPTVTYSRLSDTQYKICFDYKNASGGFDAGWTSLLSGPLGAGDQSSSDSTYSDGSYFDSYVGYRHKKGQNCQTVKPYVYSNNYNQSSQPASQNLIPEGCSSGPGTVYYQYRLSAKISSLDTVNSKIYLVTASGQVLYDGLYSGASLTQPIQYVNYSSGTKIYDANCKKISVTKLPTSKYLYFYMNSKETNFASQITAQELATQTPMPNTGCKQTGSNYVCTPQAESN